MKNKITFPLFHLSVLSLSVAAVMAQAAETPASEEVVVTGYRAALQNSTEAKKDAVGFSETIFADDIGKLPSQNLAESLNRIPGVKISREVTGEGLQITVRGLGSQHTKIALNGNNIAVATDGALGDYSKGRSVDLGLFPSELFSSLSVDKSANAHQMEGGISGYVDMRTRHAFDKTGQHIDFSIEGAYTEINEEISPKASFIYSNTFADDTIGALVGITSSRMKSRVDGYETVGYTDGCLVGNPTADAATWACASGSLGRNQVQWNPTATADYAATHPGVTVGQQINNLTVAGVSAAALDHALVPYLGRAAFVDGERNSTTELVSLEYRPNDTMSYVLDVMATQADRDFNRIDNMLWVRRANNANALIPENVVVDSNEVLRQATFYNAQFWVEARPYVEDVDFKSVMPSMSWQITDSFKMELSASKTKSTFERDMPTWTYTTPKGIATYSLTNNDVPAFSFRVPGTDFNLNSTSGWSWGGGGNPNDLARYNRDERQTETSGFHADFGVGENPNKNGIQFGLSFDKAAKYIQAYGASGLAVTATRNAAATPDVFLVPMDGSFGSTLKGNGLGYNAWAQIDYDAVKKAINYNSTVVAQATRGGDASGGSVGDIDEKYKAAYLMINNESELLGRNLKTNFGLRYVDTDQTVASFDTANQIQLSTNSSYSNWLPSFSVVYDAFDDIKLRGAASRTMSRANPADMFPNASWGSSGIDRINAGNPKLTPFFSDSVDLGGEWYFNEEGLGYVGVSFFTKRVVGFTYSSNLTMGVADAVALTGVYVGTPGVGSRQEQIDANPNSPVTVSTKLTADGYTNVRGEEIVWVQPLDFITEGLGFDISATHITQKSSNPLAEVTGISPWAYNFTASYDYKDLSLRATYYHQDKAKVTGPIDNNYDGGAGRLPYRAQYGLARSQVDLSASYTLPFKVAGDGEMTVTFDIYNLTKEPVGTWVQYKGVPYQYWNPGTTYTLGLRGKF